VQNAGTKIPRGVPGKMLLSHETGPNEQIMAFLGADEELRDPRIYEGTLSRTDGHLVVPLESKYG
jgi:hypothetical protein